MYHHQNVNSYKIWLAQVYANEAKKLIRDIHGRITHETSSVLDKIMDDLEHGITPDLQRYELPVL